MNLRKLGKTNRMVSEIGLGTWQLGTRWGDPFNEAEAMKILEASYDSGINLIDTADIYNDGNSEKAIGKFLKSHKEHFFVVTKCGRGLNPRVAEGYTPENMEAFIDGSLRRHSRGKQTDPGSLQRPGHPAPGAYPGANGRGRGHLQPIHPPLRPPKLVKRLSLSKILFETDRPKAAAKSCGLCWCAR